MVVQQRAVALFLSTPSARRATWIFDGLKCTLKRFLSTPSARRATGALTANLTTAFDFYPRPPRGGRHFNVDTFVDNLLFLSTPSARRATSLSTARVLCISISIHALREEGDPGILAGQKILCYFYPRPPRGGRPGSWADESDTTIFLSTPSARRATPHGADEWERTRFLSTPSARRATPLVPPIVHFGVISIHALREEGDFRVQHHLHPVAVDFYPRPPRGGRLFHPLCRYILLIISIHALREEGDSKFPSMASIISNFYPRPPRGGRLFICQSIGGDILFLSTPSARRATSTLSVPLAACVAFLSTPSARRATSRWAPTITPMPNFYPRPPRGGRQGRPGEGRGDHRFLSTPSARRATRRFGFQPIGRGISIHALREEGDAAKAAQQ